MIIVGIEPLEVERGLFAGEIGCPDCSGVLRPWGSARRRVLRCAAAVASFRKYFLKHRYIYLKDIIASGIQRFFHRFPSEKASTI